MSTLSIPLTPELEKFVQDTVAESGLTKADVVRQAIKHYASELAVQRVLRAAQEPTLTGDLDELAALLD